VRPRQRDFNGWFSNLQEAFDNYKVPVRHCVLNSKSEIRRLRREMPWHLAVFNAASVEAFISLDSNSYNFDGVAVLVAVAYRNCKISTESLILAQDERWRRA
jgi:hypothetical protein